MTQINYQEIIRKNDEIRKLKRKLGQSKNGKFRTTTLKDAMILSTSKKKIFVNKEALPLKLKVPHGYAEQQEIKQELNQAHKSLNSPKGLYTLAKIIEEDIENSFHDNQDWDAWKRVFAYEDIYSIAFSRGVRQERRRKNRGKV